jgi:hypothetical protein
MAVKKKASNIKFATLPKLIVYLTHPAEHGASNWWLREGCFRST